MIVDMHIHVMGCSAEYGNRLSGSFRASGILRRILKQNNIDPSLLRTDKAFDEFILDKAANDLDESVLDYGLVLALDAAYQPNGRKTEVPSDLTISNDFIFELARRSKKVLAGGSVHPYRKDALAELDRCSANGVRLIKWIPSVQNIDMDSPLCNPFYEFLRENRIPLLVHIGNEHSLRSVDQKLNHIQKIKKPLSEGVTVIAAHLGMRLFYHEPCYFREWTQMIHQHPNLHGDISAFTLPSRVRCIDRIRKSPELAERVFYGSDFPSTHLPLSFIHKIGVRNYLRIKKEPNAFNRSYYYYKALGIPEAVFSNFLKLT